ncbi:MAG: phosphate ABC transporter substrate-binding protein PstS [Candidatus Nanopelagicaceae bacterium]
MKLKHIFAAGLVAAAPAAALAGPAINGAGASFPAPIYQRWFADYARATGNRVNYQSVGSGAGVRQFVAGTVNFGASDEAISAADAAKVKRGVVQIPMVGGTIAVAYNKPGCTLKLTQKQTVDIFAGRIKNWNQVGCAAGPMTVVHRSDGSGTTFAFTNSLKAFGGWSYGAAKSVNWPTGIGAKGNEGVAGRIRQSNGAIGYVNTGFIKANKLQAAAIQNKAGKFVLPTAAAGSAALNGIKLDANLAGENPNPAGATAYPISTLTWILAYKTGNGANTDVIRKALNYALSTKAQSLADDLGYVPLSGSILNRARIAVNRIGQ